MNEFLRKNNRQFDQIRSLKITYDVFGYSDGSVLFEIGQTKVLCSVVLDVGVPIFLKGKNEGWLTAEYSLLPTSTHIRISKESCPGKKNGRSIEISRLIGRSLRSVINFKNLGEYTIYVDCNVLQADGGTRTASITGSFLALKKAESKWLAQGNISKSLFLDDVSAVSVGLIGNSAILDIDFEEDNKVDADFNFVLTKSGKIIEFQGTAEKKPISWENFSQISILARQGIDQIFSFINLNQ